MKSLLLALIALTIASGAQARSILTFKTVSTCQTYTKQEPVVVDVKEAQDGQSLLVIAYPLKPGSITKVLAKKTVPPKMMAGGSTQYSGKTEESKESVTLSIGTRPLKVGKIVGRSATLKLERQDEISLICSAAASK